MASWMNSGISPQSLERALSRLEAAFMESTGPEAVVARREAGRATPADRSSAVERMDEIVGAQLPDGSWRGSLVRTAEALIWLSELASSKPSERVRAAAQRGTAWLRTLRGRPGRYGDSCTPEDHRLGICQHFLGGFFAPEPPLSPGEELVLTTGARFPGGAAARLAASCLALQACLRWGVGGRDAWLHLDGLRRLLELDPRGTAELVPVDVLPSVVLALLEAHDRPWLEAVTSQALNRLMQSQRADGSWPEMDALYILDVLLTAATVGFRTPALDAAIRRGAGLLAVTQREDGQWERGSSPRRTLVAWRTLRYAVQLDGTRAAVLSDMD